MYLSTRNARFCYNTFGLKSIIMFPTVAVEAIMTSNWAGGGNSQCFPALSSTLLTTKPWNVELVN